MVVVAALLAAAVLREHRRLSRAINARVSLLPTPRLYPSISVIRPVRGLDAEAESNFAAALENVYPGPIETLFVFDDIDEPALPLARKAIEAHQAAGHHGRARIIIAGPPPADRTGKLNAMIAGLAHAGGELVAFGDSDTRPDPLVLRQVVDKLLASPNAGAAFAPVVIPSRPCTAGDTGAALMLNGLYGPAVAETLARTGAMPFLMGQLMVFRRKALEALEGLQVLSGHLVDDMQIGLRLAALGFRNVVASHALPVVVQNLGLLTFARMFRRWLIFSRSGLPMGTFKRRVWMRGLQYWLGLLLVLGAALAGDPLLALVPVVVPATLTWSIVHLHRKLGGAPLPLRHIWVPAVILLAGPFAVLSALLWPRVAWRGRQYRLNMRSRLASRRAPKKSPESCGLGPVNARGNQRRH